MQRFLVILAPVLLMGCGKNSETSAEKTAPDKESTSVLHMGENIDSRIDPKKIVRFEPISAQGVRTAVVDCRAGCQGDEKKCQESVLHEARIDSVPGQYLDASTLRISRKWNASDSPGLKRDPNWIVTRWPDYSSHPTSIVIRPDLRTCEGVSKHTQGVTFYEFSVSSF